MLSSFYRSILVCFGHDLAEIVKFGNRCIIGSHCLLQENKPNQFLIFLAIQLLFRCAFSILLAPFYNRTGE